MEANEDLRRIRYAYPIDIQCNGLFDIFRHYNPDLPPRRPPPHYYHYYHKQDMIAFSAFCSSGAYVPETNLEVSARCLNPSSHPAMK